MRLIRLFIDHRVFPKRSPLLLVGLLALIGLAAAACAEPGAAPTAPDTPAQPKVASPAAKAAVSPVPSPGVAVSPVASPMALPAVVAVTANQGDRSLSLIDVTTGRVFGTVALGRPPSRVALSPDAQLAFASDATQGSNAVLVVGVPTQQQVETLQVGSQPVGIDVHERQPLAVVANSADDSITIYDAKTRAVSGRVPVGDEPMGVALVGNAGTAATPVPPDQAFTWAYVANAGDDTVSVVDVEDRRVVATVDVGDRPTTVVASRDESRVFVLNEGSNTVSVIDVPGNQEVAEIEVGPNLTDLAMGPALETLYVTARDPGSNLYRIDLSNNQVAESFDVLGAGPQAAPAPGLATTPAPSPGAAASPVAQEPPGVLAAAAGPDPDTLLLTTTENNLVYWSISRNTVTRTVPVGQQPVDVAMAAVAGPVLQPGASPVASPMATPAAPQATTAQPSPTRVPASPTAAGMATQPAAAATATQPPAATPTAEPSPTEEATPSATAAAAGTPSASAQEVSVAMTEFNFTPTQVTVQADRPVELTAQNTGTLFHTWTVVEGDIQASAQAQPGESSTITFTPQQPGTYRVICTVPGHAEAGMVGQLVVQQ